MNQENRLDASITQWNLLESPFYQAWNQGALPVESLRDYAHEYGAFLSLIAKGWASHGSAAACETMCRALRTALDAPAPADCLSVQ